MRFNVRAGYLYRQTSAHMTSKIALSIAALVSNLLLFALMMSLQNRDGLHLGFVLVRIILVTSVIMQILVAFGFVKLNLK